MQPLLQWTRSKAYSECVCRALLIHNAMCMHHIFIYGQSGSTEFFKLSHKQHNFQKNGIEHTMCVLIFSITFV